MRKLNIPGIAKMFYVTMMDDVSKRIEEYGGTLRSRQVRGLLDVLAERLAETTNRISELESRVAELEGQDI